MELFRIALRTIPRPLLIRLSYIVRPLLALAFRGSTYTDPIDGKCSRKFLPYGYASQRKNALSPTSLSLERHRLLWLYLKRETNFFTAPLKVLHIAPEQPFYKRFKKLKNLDYVTADLTSPLADVKADLTQLPFASNEFDVIFCNHVLEHITDDIKAMQELYRVMKPNGWGIFQVPIELHRAHTFEDPSVTSPRERSKQFGQYDHVRIYGTDFFQRLRSVGFEVEALLYAQLLPPSMVTKYCLLEDKVLPICYKNAPS